MVLSNTDIENAIRRSQHCQRNWDLSKQVSQDDLDLLITCVTQCPSKQNVAHYRVHAITNRDIIEKIHDNTRGFTTSYVPYAAETNSQVLANLLIVFEEIEVDQTGDTVAHRSDETRMILNGELTPEAQSQLLRDRHMAVGIASGYCNITAALLGYNTGYCACFDSDAIKEILGLNNEIILLLGIGFKDVNLNRRVHHKNHEFIFPTKEKQQIQVNYIR